MEESDHNFRTADIWRRPQTDELVDVHVYLVPSDKWIEQRKLAKRDIIDHAVSTGFVRVLPSTTLLDLRADICEQLGTENVPETYVFLRSVGRNFTQVKSKQELDLKVKSFVPPYAEEPEVYIKKGSYTPQRSASLGPEVRLPRETSRVPTDSSVDFPTSSESTQPSVTDSEVSCTLAVELQESNKRSQSLDRLSMAFRRPTPVPQQRTAQRRPLFSKNTRPPTPRIKELPLNNENKQRSRSITSVTKEEVIKESPTELPENGEISMQNLAVIDDDVLVVNSPPPKPSPAAENKEVQIPVHISTPVSGNKIQECGNSQNVNDDEIDNLLEANSEQDNAKGAVDSTLEHIVDQTERRDSDNSVQINVTCNFDEEVDTGTETNCHEERHLGKSDILLGEQSELSFENIHSKMGDEDVIVDPIKLLRGREILRISDETGREYFDEGFHSGELVNSEEDNKSIETVESSGIKDDDLQKPTRTATPMPKSSSFCKSVNLDPKIKNLQAICEDAKAERKLKELKRDALLHKVKEMQRRKASSKDQAREEWRKRYMEVKKSTPRLEDHCSKLRNELEKLVKDMLVSIKADPDANPHKPSKKTSYKIMIMRLLQEVEDLRRRLQSVAVKLNAETKLRAQAEFEVKKLRQDLLHKKTQVTLTRKQASFPQTTEQFFISAV